LQTRFPCWRGACNSLGHWLVAVGILGTAQRQGTGPMLCSCCSMAQSPRGSQAIAANEALRARAMSSTRGRGKAGRVDCQRTQTERLWQLRVAAGVAMKSTTYWGEVLGLSVCVHVYIIQGDGFQGRFLATSGFFVGRGGGGDEWRKPNVEEMTNDQPPSDEWGRVLGESDKLHDTARRGDFKLKNWATRPRGDGEVGRKNPRESLSDHGPLPEMPIGRFQQLVDRALFLSVHT
jgi:hypothetical protein